MNIHVEKIVVFSFKRLLVDIQCLSKLPLGTPDDISYEWLLKQGPLLDKEVLAYIEGTRAESPEFPEWLTPLWDMFLSLKEAQYLRWLRQILVFCYKVEHEPTSEQLRDAQASFEETDDIVGCWDRYHSDLNASPLYRTARQYVGSIIYRINWSEIVPNHGPGSVYPPRAPSEKGHFRTLYSSIQPYYPFDQYFCGLPSFWDDVLVKGDSSMRVEETITAKLSAVPKDSRGPRLICVHPAEAIWIQQGQRHLLEDAITRSPLTKGKINFTDQTVNGQLALTSSRSGYLCTLDLKEASDRLSSGLIRYLFGDYVYEVISCARASKIKLLDGRVRDLKKWAPMGNALCFPVQSLVFFSLVRAGIRCRYGINCNDIYVFGDDILFPSQYYEGAIYGLVASGLVPNVSKTFRKGLFRESCGVDAYNGVDVTPLRMKKADITTAQGACSLLDLAKRLRQRGYEHCSSFLYSSCRRQWGYLPLSNNPNAEGFVEYVDRDLGWLLLHEPRLRFRKGFQKWAVPCRLLTDRTSSIRIGDWYHLQDAVLRLARKGSEVSDRGTEYAIPYSVRLSYGWSDCTY